MTRYQLIAEIMAQVCNVTEESDEDLRCDVEQKLRCTALPVLREIYSTNAVQQAVIRAKKSLLAPIPRPADTNGASHPAQSEGARRKPSARD